MDRLNLFVPITKVDVEKRLVYGTIAAEVADKSGEIMDYATAKPEFEAWSAEIAKASNGASVGNIRAMHGQIAAGKLETIAFDDAAKRIEGCGKIVDDAEWNKVLEGVYTGFSMGGKYAKRWKDADAPHLTRYTPTVSEISIVDNPCIPSATFEMVKADGTTELRKFKAHDLQPTNRTDPEVEQGWKARDGSFHATKAAALKHNTEADAAALAKTAAALDALGKLDAVLTTKGDGKKPYGDVEYADPGYRGDKKKRYPIDTETHIRAAWNYISKPRNAGKYGAEDAGKIKAKIAAAWKDKIDRDGPPSAADKAAMAINLAKSLYDVADISAAVLTLNRIKANLASEAACEGDNSPAPDRLKAIIGELCAFLVALATEETNEIIGGEDEEYEGDEYDILEMAAYSLGLEKATAMSRIIGGKPLGRALAKAGARHSKADMARVQKLHDTACELGAECPDGTNTNDDDGDTSEDTAKLAKIAAENIALKTTLDGIVPKVEAATAKITQMQAEIDRLNAQPAAGGPIVTGTRTVSKGQDSGGSDPVKAFQDHLATLPAGQRALAMMKMSLAQPSATIPEPMGRRA